MRVMRCLVREKRNKPRRTKYSVMCERAQKANSRSMRGFANAVSVRRRQCEGKWCGLFFLCDCDDSKLDAIETNEGTYATERCPSAGFVFVQQVVNYESTWRFQVLRST